MDSTPEMQKKLTQSDLSMILRVGNETAWSPWETAGRKAAKRQLWRTLRQLHTFPWMLHALTENVSATPY